MIRRPPRSTLFPYTTALPISPLVEHMGVGVDQPRQHRRAAKIDHLRSRRNLHLSLRPNLCDSFSRNNHHLRSEEHTSELQSHLNLVCRLLLEKKKKTECFETP